MTLTSQQVIVIILHFYIMLMRYKS